MKRITGIVLISIPFLFIFIIAALCVGPPSATQIFVALSAIFTLTYFGVKLIDE